MNNRELKELVFNIAKSQDKIAFGKIFDYFALKVMDYLINSGTSKEISEETMQDVLITLWQKTYQFNENIGNVGTWIFTITKNKRIDRILKN